MALSGCFMFSNATRPSGWICTDPAIPPLSRRYASGTSALPWACPELVEWVIGLENSTASTVP